MNFLSTDLGRLWAATAVSHMGTMLGALSLTALVYLDASPAQMGVLTACTTAPAILLAPVAGVWVDRLPLRAVLLFADFGRFALLLTIPGLALIGSLGMEQLYVVAFSAACLEIAFELAYRAILPTLVEEEALVGANAKLRAAEGVSESVAPMIGGGIVQAFGAPIAVVSNAATFLASGLFLTRLSRSPKPLRTEGLSMWREATTGARTAVADARLRAILGMSATYGFFGSFLIALFALRVLRELDFSPIALGALAIGGGLGSFAGAGIVTPLTQRLGTGRAIILAYVLAVLFDLSIPLAGGPAWLAFSVLFGGGLLGNAFYVVENVASLSLRQAITPREQLGRVNAVFLVVNRSLRPIGALVAGFTAEAIGIQAALFIGVLGALAASFWLLLSPLIAMKPDEQLGARSAV